MNKPLGYYGSKRLELFKFIPANLQRVLDVGCGAGNFGLELKNRFGTEVWGIENSEEAAREAREKLDKLIVGNIESESFELPHEYFDGIIFNDILEHLINPWNVLKKIKKHLKHDGYVLASIPNIRYYAVIKDLLVYKKWKYEEEGILDIDHLRFFTKKSIRNLFSESGFNLVKIEGIKAVRFSLKWKILNRMLFNQLDDMRFLQFVCVAKKAH